MKETFGKIALFFLKVSSHIMEFQETYTLRKTTSHSDYTVELKSLEKLYQRH